jgi:hypothetical protein
MNKLIILVLLSILSLLLNAEEIKQSKDFNKTMSNDEFMKKWKVLEQREKVANEKIKKIDEIQKTLDGLEKKTNKD